MILALLLSTILASPDVYMISVDTLRADHLGCYGYDRNTSPHIDQLAAKGMLFENVVPEVPLTNASFGAMMSSRVPRSTGAIRNALPMPSNVPLVAERFKKAGYQTFCVQSNWTLKAGMSGLNRGFDIYDDHFHKRRWFFFVSERRADKVTRIALKLLKKRDKSKPLFMWIHYSDPHAPYKKHWKYNPAGVPLRKLDKTGQIRARYDSEIAYTDHYIGKLLKAIPKKNAYILFVADHGESLMEHGYLGHGRRIYQTGLHIPLILCGPDIKAQRISAPARGLDIGPTLLGMAGLSPWPDMQGVNLLKTRPKQNRIRVVETYGGAAIVPGMKHEMANAAPIRQGMLANGWKLILNGHKSQLYHLTDDPKELHNLSDKNPKKVAEFEGIIKKWTKAHPKREAKQKDLNKEDVKALESLGYL